MRPGFLTACGRSLSGAREQARTPDSGKPQKKGCSAAGRLWPFEFQPLAKRRARVTGKARFSGFVSNGRAKGKAAERAATQAASHTKTCRWSDKSDQGVACGRGRPPHKRPRPRGCSAATQRVPRPQKTMVCPTAGQRLTPPSFCHRLVTTPLRSPLGKRALKRGK